MSRTLARIRDAIGDPVFVRSGRGLAPTPRALELREQVRGVVEQAHAIFTSGREVDLRTLERTFSLCTNDVFVGAYGGKLRDLLASHASNTVLRFFAEGDGESDDDALQAGRIDLCTSAPCAGLLPTSICKACFPHSSKPHAPKRKIMPGAF